eukprot:11226216-Lingulodinium_polyedra.AAC.1
MGRGTSPTPGAAWAAVAFSGGGPTAEAVPTPLVAVPGSTTEVVPTGVGCVLAPSSATEVAPTFGASSP